jgi:hypothetical protein
MTRDVIIHQIEDWSVLNGEDDIWSKIDLSIPEINFGIHKFQDKLWSSGYVGIGRLCDKNGQYLQSSGKEHILVVSSRYGMEPWHMLEMVMADDEYDDYIAEMESDGRSLFKVFYDQPLIKFSQDIEQDGALLYALSFITSCYGLCKKGLKKTMIRQEDNYSSKVRGKIEIKKNIRMNTCKGRSDRFYCKYIDFTEDNIENRILKATLLKCKEIIGRCFPSTSEVSKRVAYCMNSFRRVKTVRIKTSDFNGVAAAGLYMYYKPLLQQARCIYSQKYYAYKNEAGQSLAKSVFTIPYMINMEALFEFYTRVILKHTIDQDKYSLDRYSKKLYLQKDVANVSEVEKGIHLMSYCIPDIIIRDNETQNPVAVIDAKYKPSNRSVRTDTHQLLSYVLLTGVKKCGFAFPGAESRAKIMRSTGSTALPLSVDSVDYYELIFGNDSDNTADIFSSILP